MDLELRHFNHKHSNHISCTTLNMPEWWVRAFEVAVGSNFETPSLKESTRYAKLIPALSAAELSALALLVSEVQRQVLDGQATVELFPEKHSKFITTSSKSKQIVFKKVLQGIGGLRVLVEQGERQLLSSQALFSSEQWFGQQASGGDLSLKLRLNSVGEDFFLGMAEPYTAFNKMIQERRRPIHVCCSFAPLHIQKSAWLDLGAVEQTILLRLERQVQWVKNWLQLSGIFGVDFFELVQGVRVARRSSENALEGVFVFLKKLGKKLVDHGMLARQVSDQYLGLGDMFGQGVQLIYQLSHQRLHELEEGSYLKKVNRYFSAHKLLPRYQEILSSLSMGTHVPDALMKWSESWGELDESQDFVPSVVGRWQSRPINTKMLFAEWVLRQQGGHSVPLPEELRSSESAKYCLGDLTFENISSVFRKFCQSLALIADDSDSLSIVDEGFDRLQELTKFVEVTPPARTQGNPKEQIRKYSENPNIPISESHAQNSKGVHQAKLRLVASEELVRLRKNDKAQYESLKAKYFDSLDPSSKSLIVEVRKQMQKEKFEEHLKRRLISYMVKNPNQWTSTKTLPLS